MKKHYSFVSGLILGTVLMLPQVPAAFADDTSQFNQYLQTTHTHRAQMEGQLGLEATGDPFLERAPSTFVEDSRQFDQSVQVVRAHRAQMETHLGLDPNADPFPQATCYYDDKVDHIEQVLLTFDTIDRGI